MDLRSIKSQGLNYKNHLPSQPTFFSQNAKTSARCLACDQDGFSDVEKAIKQLSYKALEMGYCSYMYFKLIIS